MCADFVQIKLGTVCSSAGECGQTSTWVTQLALCQHLEFFVAGCTALVGLAELKLQSGHV